MLLRLGNMRGLDLGVFDFDYDLTWAGLFLDADGRVHGRYGGRSADGTAQNSLKGLRHALQEALARQGRSPVPRTESPLVRKVEDYAAARQLPQNACVHCHHVYDFRREARQAASTWKIDDLWVYPEPRNIGVVLDIERGNRVRDVLLDSAAAQIQMRRGDVLHTLNGYPIGSIADVQYALHRAPAAGAIPLSWERDGYVVSSELALPAAWRKTDVSWRWSLRALAPPPSVHGEDLTPQEKKALGLDAKQLAFRQGNFLSTPARQAGIRSNDVIVGVDGKVLRLTARQFDAYVRINYKVGDVVTYNLLRGQERLDVKLKLVER